MNLFTTGLNLLASAAILFLSLVPSPACAYNWLQFGGDPQHTGNNTQETILDAGNVSGLQRLYQVTLSSPIDGPITYLYGVQTADGPRDLVFGTTMAGGILALDAHTGQQVWAKQAYTGACKTADGYDCTVHSAAAIDPNRSYVYSYSLDGYVHKYQVADGTEITSGGWPELATLKPDQEKQSSSLVFARTRDGHAYLYVPFASFAGDIGEYQGHIVAIDLDSGAQKVFNMVCSDQTDHFALAPGTPDCPTKGASVWGRATVVYVPGLDKIFTTTANADFDPSLHYWGDTVVALNPDGSGANGDPLDTYTPTNYADLNNFDTDLGSAVPAILPTPPGSKYPYLALQGGKDAKLRLLDLADLSGQGGVGHTGGEVAAIIDVPQGDEIRTAPVVWINPSDSSTWVFISNDSGISALKLVLDSSGNPSLATQWVNTTYTDSTSPHMANGVLYLASTTGQTTGVIRALDPLTGDPLWSDDTISNIHWSVPVVANGVLYITDEGSPSPHLTAYALNGALPQVSVCWKYSLPLVAK